MWNRAFEKLFNALNRIPIGVIATIALASIGTIILISALTAQQHSTRKITYTPGTVTPVIIQAQLDWSTYPPTITGGIHATCSPIDSSTGQYIISCTIDSPKTMKGQTLIVNLSTKQITIQQPR